MAEPRLSHSASRLSEDIGDVLSAIRRMIAEDDALSSTRDRLQAERDALDTLIQSNAIQEDAGDFLARRYGGDWRWPGNWRARRIKAPQAPWKRDGRWAAAPMVQMRPARSASSGMARCGQSQGTCLP